MSVQVKTNALLVGMATGGLIAASLIGLGNPTAAAASGCSDVEVVFARGTDEPVGLGREGQAFVDSLKGDLRGKSVSAYAVNYPASRDFIQATAGAIDASAHVQATVAACPSTKIVLGGYSQGAAVIDGITGDPAALYGLGQPMPPEVANHVAAVAVLGNPLNRFGGPLTALSPLYGAKTVDLCNGADPVCSPGDDRPAHSQYIEAGLVSQAAAFAADRINAKVPSAA
jgi:cutinase